MKMKMKNTKKYKRYLKKNTRKPKRKTHIKSRKRMKGGMQPAAIAGIVIGSLLMTALLAPSSDGPPGPLGELPKNHVTTKLASRLSVSEAQRMQSSRQQLSTTIDKILSNPVFGMKKRSKLLNSD